MRSKKVNKNVIMMIIVLFITLGYAYLNSELKINGTTGIAGNTWDVHFENVVPSSSNTVTPTIAPVANPIDKVTELTYSIKFNKPGDIYEFDVDIVNAGSIDAMVELITSTIKIGNGEVQELNNSTLPSYINYYVKYSDGVNISPNHLLNKESRETIKVHVEYKSDISEEDLTNSAGKTIEFTYSIDYIQAGDGAKPRPIANNCTYNGTMYQGATYTNGQYTYKYMQERNGGIWNNITADGWGVTLTNSSSTDSITTPLCTSINGKPIVSMSYMFYYSRASSIDLSSFDTSNVINMNNMFTNMSSVTSLDVGYLDTSNVINMESMFYNNAALQTIDNLDNLNTKKVTSMESMFKDSKLIKDIKITKWDFSNVENVDYMFYNLGYNSTGLNFEVRNMNIPKVTSILRLFEYVGYYAPKFDLIIDNVVGDNAINVNSLFDNLGNSSKNAKVLINNINFKNATNANAMFNAICESAENVDLKISNVNIESFVNIDYNKPFQNIGKSSKGNFKAVIENINMKSLVAASGMFLDIGYDGEYLDIKVNNININSASNLNNLFSSLGQRANELLFEASNIHAHNATTADGCFTYAGQSSSKVIMKIKDWDTPELNSTAFMFDHVAQIGAGVDKKYELTIDNLDMSKVTTIRGMFSSNGENNNGITKIVFKNINTPSLTSVNEMFKYAGASSSVFTIEGLSNFDYSHVTNFDGMFLYAGNSNTGITDLGTIDIYGGNTDGMFNTFKGVKVILNLHNKPSNYSGMFSNAATTSGASIVVNYTAEVDNIDDIIATKSDNSNVIKGQLID